MRTGVILCLVLISHVFFFFAGAWVENAQNLIEQMRRTIEGQFSQPNPPSPPEDDRGNLTYFNVLHPVAQPLPILANYPEFVAPIKERSRFESPPLILDQTANLSVRAWRYSYNARAIIEIPNKLNGLKTALLVVHPWGIDDLQGLMTPEPAGVAFFCTPQKNALYHRHIQEVINPFLDRLRPHVALIAYSLPGQEDSIRKKLYKSPRTENSDLPKKSGITLLERTLHAFPYKGEPIPSSIRLERAKEITTYFSAFNGCDASSRYNHEGFWDLPIPLAKTLKKREGDVVFYDGHWYEELKDYLKKRGIQHILLAGYATDICVKNSTAGYQNLKKDFNVFVVGDATLANFPAQDLPNQATSIALATASLNNLITETAWIHAIQ
jgi:hypothetical protein